MPSASSALALPVQIQSNSPLDVGLLVLGVVALLVVVGLFGAVRVAMIQGTGQSDGPSPDELTNCPGCGARTPIADETCDYCGDPLPGGSD